MLLSLNTLSSRGRPSDSRTFLRVLPDCVGNTTRRLAAHWVRSTGHRRPALTGAGMCRLGPGSGAMAVLVGHMRERSIQDGNVVGGGVAARVPAPEREGLLAARISVRGREALGP